MRRGGVKSRRRAGTGWPGCTGRQCKKTGCGYRIEKGAGLKGGALVTEMAAGVAVADGHYKGEDGKKRRHSIIELKQAVPRAYLFPLCQPFAVS